METVCPAVVEVAAIPTTDCVVVALAFELVVERSRTTLPMMLLTPAEVATPRICEEVEIELSLLLRFATVLPVISALVPLVLRMPVTC